MKKIITVLFAVVLCISAKSQLFTATGNLLSIRACHGSELLNNGKVLVFGGNNFNYQSYLVYKTAELYNAGVWTSAGNMINERDYPASSLLANGNVMVIGGKNNAGTELASCEIYNVATNTWSYTDSMSTARHEARSVLLDNGKILVVGGNLNVTCELYDQTTNTWTPTGSYSIARYGYDIAKLPNGNVLLVGGNGPGGTTWAVDTAEIYNVSSGTWSKVSDPLNYKRAGNSAILMSNGKVLIAGGQINKSTEIFDPVTNTFSLAGNLVQMTSSSKMVNLSDGRVLIYGIGDLFAIDRQALQVFDPNTNLWLSAGVCSATSVMTGNLYSVNILQNGRILYAGGNFSTGNGAHNKCYLINPASVISNLDENVNSNSKLFQAYPNPANDELNLKVSQVLLDSHYKIIDQSGKIVMNGIILNENTNLNISKLANGNYIFQIGEQTKNSLEIIKK